MTLPVLHKPRRRNHPPPPQNQAHARRRSLWGDGQADSLKCVVDTKWGKVGGLNCWEHLQPLLRYCEYSQGVEIHVAGWPPFWKQPKDILWPYHISDEAESRVCQFSMSSPAPSLLIWLHMRVLKHVPISRSDY